MSSIDQVRLLIGDTGSVQFTDAQIQAFLDMALNDILMAASYALESWAASITDSMKSEKIGDYAYSMDSAGNKIKLAEKYAKEAAATPYLSWAEMDLTAVGEPEEMGE